MFPRKLGSDCPEFSRSSELQNTAPTRMRGLLSHVPKLLQTPPRRVLVARRSQPRNRVRTNHNGEPITILDVLNPDCWRAVLDWLDVDDVVRSERVSRGWQRVVQEYLQGVHSYCIVTCRKSKFKRKEYNKYLTCQKLINFKNKDKCFLDKMLKKIGPFIVTLLVDDVLVNPWLKVISENCPNLEDFTILQFHCIVEDFSFDRSVINCKIWERLKRVTFACGSLREKFLLKTIAHKTLEELVIIGNHHVTGRFLPHLKSTNLKKLALNSCLDLNFQHILAAASCLTELTALEMNDNMEYVFEQVHLLLGKTPKLEHLSLSMGDALGNEVIPSTELVESIGRLSRLKHLNMDGAATDALLVAVGRGCKELRSLSIQKSPEVTGRALVSLCRELPALAELSVAGNDHLSEKYLAACVTSCHSLTKLNAPKCAQVTVALVEACARAVRGRRRRRARPLRLRLSEEAQVDRNTVQALFPEETRMGLAVTWEPNWPIHNEIYWSDESDESKSSSDESYAGDNIRLGGGCSSDSSFE